ncbi:MAG: squalene/phytoene synthase family protein [Pseudomonadota bacterium]
MNRSSALCAHPLLTVDARIDALLHEAGLPVATRIERLQTLAATASADAAPLFTLARRRLEDGAPADFAALMSPCREHGSLLARACLARGMDERRRALADGLGTAWCLFDSLLSAQADVQAGIAPWLSLDEMTRFQVSEEDLRQGRADFAWRRLVEARLQRVMALLQATAPGARQLGLFGGWPLRLAIVRLERLCNALRGKPELAFEGGPRLTAADWPPMLWRAVRGGV